MMPSEAGKCLSAIFLPLFSCQLLATAHAKLSLPHIISDNMMLQRDKPTRIWGRGDDGTAVTTNPSLVML